MRFYETMKRAQVELGVDPKTVTNVMFMDRLVLSETGVAKPIHQVTGFHFYNEAEELVTQFSAITDFQSGDETFQTITYQAPADPGFATRRLPSYDELLPVEAMNELASGMFGPFLKGKRDIVKVSGLVSSFVDVGPNPPDAYRWPFVASDPKLFAEPAWMSAMIDAKTGAAQVIFVSAVTGSLLLTYSLALPLEALLAGRASSGLFILASLGWILLKILIIIAFCVALYFLWPAAGLAGAALLAAKASFAATILSLITVLIDFFREATAAANASPGWRARYEAIQARLEAAKAKATAAREQNDMDKLKEAIEEELDALDDLDDLYEEPEAESGLDASDSKEVREALKEATDALRQALETWPG